MTTNEKNLMASLEKIAIDRFNKSVENDKNIYVGGFIEGAKLIAESMAKKPKEPAKISKQEGENIVTRTIDLMHVMLESLSIELSTEQIKFINNAVLQAWREDKDDESNTKNIQPNNIPIDAPVQS
jgi:predicted class III extradiol MEMO1 family dioxygenase